MMAATMVTSAAITASPAAAANNGALAFSVGSPSSILYGQDVAYTLNASNPSGPANGFNLSWRVVLPAGTTFASSSAGNPTTYPNSPTAGETTLVFLNTDDLQIGVNRTLDIAITPDLVAYPVGSSITIAAGAYMSGDVRLIPDFDTTGAHVDNADTNAFTTGASTTRVEAISLTKLEPNAEAELLRGVHNEWTTYSLTVQNNFVNPTGTIIINDYLPAGLEFLGCGAVDNTSATPITNPSGVGTEEYPGSGALGVGVAPVDPTGTAVAAVCVDPDAVTTESLAAGAIKPGSLAGVYTHVTWNLTDTATDPLFGVSMAPGQAVEIMYAAGIPIRQNAMFTSAPAGIAAMANLDNNTGALTSDEQNWTNWAIASGIYHPGVLDASTSDFDTEIVIAEDLSIHKTVSLGSFVQGTNPRWSLLIETGEYRSATNLRVTDILPDGQCPLLAGGNSESATGSQTVECDNAVVGAPAPTISGAATDPDTSVEQSNGSHVITWNSLRPMTIDDSILVEFSSNVRAFYQTAFENDLPVNGGDYFNNTVTILGDTTPIATVGGTDLDRVFELDTPDASAASMQSQVVSIDKSVSVPSAPGVTLDCNAATYTTAAPPTPDVSPWAYRPGDRVCYKVVVDFPLNLDYRNPVVRDFIPPNTAFEQVWGVDAATGATATNDTIINELHDSVLGSGNPVGAATTALAWKLGVDTFANGDLYVDETAHHFEVIFSVKILGDPRAVTTVDIVDNLAKLTVQNSAVLGGTTWSTRDQAGFVFVEPHISLDKRSGAADVAANVESTVDIVRQGDTVPYEVAITNDFQAPASPSDAAYARASVISGWDILPIGLSCSDLTAASLDVPGVVTCFLPPSGGGTAPPGGYPLTGTIHDGRSVLVFTVDNLDPGATALLTYGLVMPIGLAAGQLLTNDAGVRQYSPGLPNDGTVAPIYIPASNIDPSLTTPNTTAANASSSITLPNASVIKVQQSSITDGVAGTNLQNLFLAGSVDEATIGEHIAYRFTTTVPAGTDLHGATITDTLNNKLDFVALTSTGATLFDGTSSTAITLSSATSGFFDVDGTPGLSASDVVVSETLGVITVAFPATWHNPAGSGDDIITVGFDAVVNANASRGQNVRNKATLAWNDSTGAALPTVSSSNLTTRVVEPNPQIAKTDSGTDTDVPTDGLSNVAPGDTVTYTLAVTNPDDGSGRVSVAHDLVVTDALPVGVTLATNPDGGVFTAGTGSTLGTLTWDATQVAGLASLAVGATVNITYSVTVDNPAIASSRLTNTANVTATSLAGIVAGERTSYSATTTDTIELPLAIIAKDVAPFDSNPFDLIDTDNLIAAVGQPVDMQVAIKVPQNNRVHDATIFDQLPSTLVYESAATPVVSTQCQRISGTTLTAMTASDVVALTPSGQTLGWWLGDVEATGGDCVITIDYTVHVASSATAASTPTNSARLVWNIADTISTTPAAVTDIPAPTSPSWSDSDGPVSQTLDVIEPKLAINKNVKALPGPTTCEPSADADTCDTESGVAHQYTVIVTNNGDGPAHDITVVDTLPTAGESDPVSITGGGVFASTPARTITWTITGPLAAGASVSFTYETTAGPSSVLSNNQTLVDTADVTQYWGLSSAARTQVGGGLINTDVPTNYGGTRNPVTADVVTLTARFPDLVIEKLPASGMDATDARAGQVFRWRLVVHNDGAGAGYGIDVSDTLPTGWLYQTGSAKIENLAGTTPVTLADPTGGSTGPLAWTNVVSSLAPGKSFAIEYDLVPQASLLTVGTTGSFAHVNDSAVTGDDATGATSNVTGSYGDNDGAANGTHGSDDAIARIRRVDVSLTKTILETAPYYYGDFITYRISVSNAGVNAATGVTVTDVLDPGLVYVSDTSSFGDYVPATNTWTLAGPLASGTFASVDIVVQINTTSAVSNTAEVATTDQWDIDSTPGNLAGAGVNEDDDATISFTPLSVGLGNKIWFDLNADGVQQPAEPGIPNVGVSVSWIDPADGTTLVTRNATTDTSGNYSFTGLPNDTAMTVAVDSATLPAGMVETFELKDNPVIAAAQSTNAATTFDNKTAGIVLPGTVTGYMDVDFGYTGTGSLGDLVWFDSDNSGTATAAGSDQGIPNVGITVDWAGWDGVLGDNPATTTVDESADDLAYTATTDANGAWGVGNLPAGTYRTTVTTTDLPSGVTNPTWDRDFGASASTADLDSTTTVALPAGVNLTDLDFSYTGVGSIGDRVWLDVNANGVFDTGEAGLKGVGVGVGYVGPAGLPVTRLVTTSADGTWSVGSLPLGVPLTVSIDTATLPTHIEATHDLDDPADGSLVTGTTGSAQVTLTTVVPVRTDVDFGYRGLGSVGDLVWFDINGNGGTGPDGSDIGLPGVDLTVTWTDPLNGSIWTTTATTGADGSWGVAFLPDGDITVTVDPATLPGGVSQTVDPDGGNDGASALILADNPDTVANERIDLVQDFAYTGTGSVGDLVWTDSNANGVVDTGEVPLAGIDVAVVWTDPVSGATTTVTVTTAADGTWNVGGLPAGSVAVTIDSATIPAGMAPTYDLDGGHDRTASLVLAPGATRTDVDFGERLEADLAVTKTHTGEFPVGGQGRFTVGVSNLGPGDSHIVKVTDSFPAGLTFVRAEGTDLSCALSGITLTCTTFSGTLAVGASATIDLIVDVAAEAAPGVTNIATVTSDNPTDPNPTNDVASDTVSVPLSVLKIDKVLDSELRSRREATWLITVTNQGPSPTSAPIVVKDRLPNTLEWRSASSDTLACTALGTVGGLVTCTTSNVLAVGESVAVRVTTFVAADRGTEIINTASVEGGNSANGIVIPTSVLGAVAIKVSGEALAFTGFTGERLISLGLMLLMLGAAAWVLGQRGRRLRLLLINPNRTCD